MCIRQGGAEYAANNIIMLNILGIQRVKQDIFIAEFCA